MTIRLGRAPPATVDIPLTVTLRGAATATDYAGIPEFVRFGRSDISRSFTVTAFEDSDALDESLTIGFGDLPAGFAPGAVASTTMNLIDNDTPVFFGAESYFATEGGTATVVTVTLGSAPGAAVDIPLTVMHNSGADVSDYSGIPANLRFGVSQTSQTFTLTATDDSDGDDGESVTISFGDLPAGFGTGATPATTVNLVAASTVPEVRSVRVTSTPAALSWYLAGETIEFTVAFSLDIAVAGDPTFGFFLDNGSPSGPRSAVYDSSRSASDTMVFTYTVTATDDDNDGIFIGAGPGTFELDSDDAIKDGWRLAGDRLDADLSHTQPGRQTGHRVSQRARVASMSITSTPRRGANMDTYGLGDQIRFQATFNRDVTVTGTPQALIEIGGRPSNLDTATTWASYDAANSGGAVVAFSYTVQASDLDDNGIYITQHQGSIVLFRLRGGAAIADTRTGGSAGDAILTYPVSRRIGGPNSNHKVNGGIGNVGVSFGADSYTAAEGGPAVTVTVTLSRAPEADVVIPLSVTRNGGASAGDHSTIPANLSFSATRTSTTFTVTATDDTHFDVGEECLRIDFGDLPSGYLGIGNTSTTVNLVDNDLDLQVKLSGQVVVGSTLSANTDDIADSDGLGSPTYAYRWLRDGADIIEDASSRDYSLVDADAGKRISVRVTFTDADNNLERRVSPRTSRVILPTRKLVGPVDSPNAANIDADPATWGQSFLTGANGHGYMLDHVRLNISLTGDPISAGQNITRLVTADSSGQATGTEVATLSSLGDLAVSTGTDVTAYAPAGVKLDQATRYAFAARQTVTSTTWSCELIAPNQLASDGLGDWAFSNEYQVLDSDYTHTRFVPEANCAMSVHGRELRSGAPYLTSLAVTSTPANGVSYGAGEQISITATFSAPVTGKLDLAVLYSDSNVFQAASVNKTGATFVFAYTVLASDVDNDGFTFPANSLTGYVDADLGHPALRPAAANRVNPTSGDGQQRADASPKSSLWQGAVLIPPGPGPGPEPAGQEAVSGPPGPGPEPLPAGQAVLIPPGPGPGPEPLPAGQEAMAGRDIYLDANSAPTGMWTDGTHMWVISDWETGQVKAYALASGAQRPGLEFRLGGLALPSDLWSDGSTLWVADYHGGVYAYGLSDGARRPAQDFDAGAMALAGNAAPTGVWSDGEIMWVADFNASRVFAYRLPDKSRLPARDIALYRGAGETYFPFGLWSDGDTLLTLFWTGSEVLGYALADGSRAAEHDLDLSAIGIGQPTGLAGAGAVLWIADDLAKRLVPFAAPELDANQAPAGDSGQ